MLTPPVPDLRSLMPSTSFTVSANGSATVSMGLSRARKPTIRKIAPLMPKSKDRPAIATSPSLHEPRRVIDDPSAAQAHLPLIVALAER